MFSYILKRILIFIPTLLIISLVIFTLSIYAPGDPVQAMMSLSGGGPEAGMKAKQSGEKAYLKMRSQLSLDLPVFYATLSSKAYPDTLYRIPRKSHQTTLNRLVNEYGNWAEINAYYQQLKVFENQAYAIQKDSANSNKLIKIKQHTGNLFTRYKDVKIQISLENIKKYASKDSSTMALLPQFEKLSSSYAAMQANPTTWKKYIPTLHFYGFNNQYHKWISKFIVLDFGKSYQDKRPIAQKVKESIYWTMLLSILSIILTYMISIPLGVYSARNKNTTSDSVITTMLFILYSLPSFWIATLLIQNLCQPNMLTEFLHFEFPAYGVGQIEGKGFFEAFAIRAKHLALPLFCWTYGGFAFLSRQMRGGMLSVLRQDYVRTARAKGLSEKVVIWKHAFRNSLLPIITLFASVFPRMIAGSVVIELIFTLPGMGKLLFDAIVFKDFPVVFTIVMLAAVLTMIGYLIADILYAVVDPRITYK